LKKNRKTREKKRTKIPSKNPFKEKAGTEAERKISTKTTRKRENTLQLLGTVGKGSRKSEGGLPFSGGGQGRGEGREGRIPLATMDEQKKHDWGWQREAHGDAKTREFRRKKKSGRSRNIISPVNPIVA